MNHRTPCSSSRLAMLALLAALGGAASACDAPDSSNDAPRAVEDLDLSRFGIAEIVASPDGYALLDGDGRDLGHVSIDDVRGITALDVTLGERKAEVSWTDESSALRCDGGAVIVEDAADGWAPTPTEGAATAACDDALAVGFEIANASGAAPPWTDDLPGDGFRWLEDFEQIEQTCSTVSTWVGGSSCWNCAQAAHDAFGRGPGWHETSSSCSSGTLWTTCSATYCI